MYKIMYLSFNDPASSPGVFRKEREFCTFLGEAGKKRGIECRGLCIVTSAGGDRECLSYGDHFELRRIPSFSYKIFSYVPLFCSIFRIRPIFSEAYREIASYRPDAIIWRFNITAVPGIFNPKKVYPPVCFISEHQAKEIQELRMTTAGRMAAPIIQRLRDMALRNIDALIGVTEEITRYELACAKRNIPSHTMTNGIDVGSYPLKNTVSPGRDSLRLLYVGSHIAHWQGLDRILEGIAAYDGKARIELHVAGSMNASTRQLIEKLGIKHHIHAHGYVEGTALDRLFDDCDIAVGTLGMHRKNLTFGSTLKVREYMARGIPFILSYTDEDLTPDLPYVFKAPADDSPIDMDQIHQFTTQLYRSHGKTLSADMHAYALKHMDYQMKIIKLLDFITAQLQHH
jgi:glycosyltransferase involved in cell wall biosynthesis